MSARVLLLACGFVAGVAHAATAAGEPVPDQAHDPVLRAKLVEAIGRADSFEDRFDAEVWLLDMSTRLQRFMPDAQERLELLRAVHAEARAAGVEPELVLAVIEVESAFDRYAISQAGALGLMQIMPFWIDEIGVGEDNLFELRTNLRFGCTILKHYLDMENGDLVKALGRYNGSYGRPQYPYKVIEALHRRWFRG